jgi:hypothetical protein
MPIMVQGITRTVMIQITGTVTADPRTTTPLEAAACARVVV